MVSVIVADAGAPSESVTVAVSRCVPSCSVRVRVAPVPSGPATSELHSIRLLRSPSKSSVAVAARETGGPAGTAAPSAGAAMVTTGGAFGARTRSPIRAWLVTPRVSVTAALTVWRPTVSARLTLPPVPSGPSRLEVQPRAPARSPSSASTAVAVNVMGPASVNTTAPSAGVSIVTAGG